ncbi:hypothetical protein PATSB16_30230 [Pandoraea thiooxydans]|uniref:lytic transglycosylase domain-containing protein n=1 Tax=Pandoraea thiooxydans TaxID=445709 RepID=UPI00094A1EBF|nr:lytic transglycosylase domain-containing protein [Pandoraea thiooxydans]APR96361.1 hypothetical protein PATSB16_30230 [Pandoraea thiooxydans]
MRRPGSRTFVWLAAAVFILLAGPVTPASAWDSHPLIVLPVHARAHVDRGADTHIVDATAEAYAESRQDPRAARAAQDAGALRQARFEALAARCAPHVGPLTLAALVRVESDFNPYAIGVVGAHLRRQPRSLAEAVATARALAAAGYNFSLGLGQINRHNLARYGENYTTIFDVCRNLHAGAQILASCYARSLARYPTQQAALRAALSCYYSGNFTTGFRQGYVTKVVDSAATQARLGVTAPAPPMWTMPRPAAARPDASRAIVPIPVARGLTSTTNSDSCRHSGHGQVLLVACRANTAGLCMRCLHTSP